MEKHTGSPSSPVTFNYHCRQVAANITNHSVYLTRKCFWNLRWNSVTPVLGQCLARTVGCPFVLMDNVADVLWGRAWTAGIWGLLTSTHRWRLCSWDTGVWDLQSGTLPHMGTPALWGHHAGGQGVHYCRRVSAPLTQAALPFPSATAFVTPKSLAQLSNGNANLIIYFGFRFGDRLCLSKI